MRGIGDDTIGVGDEPIDERPPGKVEVSVTDVEPPIESAGPTEPGGVEPQSPRGGQRPGLRRPITGGDQLTDRAAMVSPKPLLPALRAIHQKAECLLVAISNIFAGDQEPVDFGGVRGLCANVGSAADEPTHQTGLIETGLKHFALEEQ